MNYKLKLTMICACLVVAGCSVLAPRPDHSRFFILTPVADGTDPSATVASASLSSQLVIGVGPIAFPDYLRQPQIVTLTGPHQIDLSVEDRWAEPLDENFTRVFSENLAHLLNTHRIERYPWPRTNPVDYQVVVDVQSFETTKDGQSQMIARWVIKDGRSGKDLYAYETTAGTPVDTGDTGASAALSADLATLSRGVASQIVELSQYRVNTSMN
ncbi:MAG: PqiC family protein [Candidatus Binataceae bacterium]